MLRNLINDLRFGRRMRKELDKRAKEDPVWRFLVEATKARDIHFRTIMREAEYGQRVAYNAAANNAFKSIHGVAEAGLYSRTPTIALEPRKDRSEWEPSNPLTERGKGT